MLSKTNTVRPAELSSSQSRRNTTRETAPFFTKTFSTDGDLSTFTLSSSGTLVALNNVEGYEIYNVHTKDKVANLKCCPGRADIASMCVFTNDDKQFIAFRELPNSTVLIVYNIDLNTLTLQKVKEIKISGPLVKNWIGPRCCISEDNLYCVTIITNKGHDDICFINLKDGSHFFIFDQESQIKTYCCFSPAMDFVHEVRDNNEIATKACPHGTLFAYASGDKVHVVETAHMLKTKTMPQKICHYGKGKKAIPYVGSEISWESDYNQTVLCLSFSPDGKYLAACGLDQKVDILDSATGFRRYSCGAKLNSRIWKCSWSRFTPPNSPNDQSYLLACSVDNGNGIVIYDVTKGIVLYKTRVDVDICFCAFTRKNLNGRILFGYLSDRIKGKINENDRRDKAVVIHDFWRGSEFTSYDFGEVIWNLDFTLVDGEDVVIYSGKGAHSDKVCMSRLRDNKTKSVKLRKKYKNINKEVVLNVSDDDADGKFICTRYFTLENVESDQEDKKQQQQKKTFHLAIFETSTLFHEAKEEIVGYKPDYLNNRNVKHTIDIVQGMPKAAAFTSDGKQIAVFLFYKMNKKNRNAPNKHKIIIWDLQSKTATKHFEFDYLGNSSVYKMYYSPRNNILCIAEGKDCQAYFHKVEDGTLIKDINLGTGGISSIDFAPDQSEFAIAGGHKKVTVFKLDGYNITELEEYDHNNFVNDAKYSPCGNYLGIVDDNNRLQVRDLHPRNRKQLLHEFYHGVHVVKVAFNAESTMVACAGWDKKVTIRNITSVPLPEEIPHQPSNEFLQSKSYLIHRQNAKGQTILHHLFAEDDEQGSNRIKKNKKVAKKIALQTLHDIVVNRHTQVVVPIKNFEGLSPLDLAIADDNHFIAETLIDMYFKKRSITLQSLTPLHDSWKQLVNHFPDLVAKMLEHCVFETVCDSMIKEHNHGRLKLTVEKLKAGPEHILEPETLFTKAENDADDYKRKSSCMKLIHTLCVNKKNNDKSVEVTSVTIGFPGFMMLNGPFADITNSDNYEAFDTDAMRIAIKYKWETYGQKFSTFLLCMYMLVVVSFSTAMMRYLNAEWSRMERVFGSSLENMDSVIEQEQISADDYYGKRRPPNDGSGRKLSDAPPGLTGPEFIRDEKANSLLFSTIACTICVIFLLQEFREMCDEGISYINSFWNWLDCLSYSLVFLSVIDQNLSEDGAENHIMYAFTIIFLWFNVLSFLRPYHWSGPLIRMVVQIVIDLRMFMLIMFLLVVGFALAFPTIQPHNPAFFRGNAPLLVFTMMLGEFDLENYDPARVIKYKQMQNATTGETYFKILEESPNLVSRATLIMFIIYMIGVMIILLNLMIAIMGHSYEEIREHEIVEGRMERARSLVSIDRTFSYFLQSAKHIKEYYPKHLHMLKPTSFKINEGRQLSIEDLSEQLVELQQSQDDIKKLIQRFEKESIRGIS